jgi:uncharacterized protein with ATP-grasp and redox domains
VLHTADRTTTDEWLHRKILGDVMSDLGRVDDKTTPAEVIHELAKRTARTLGVPDPYAEEKRRWIEETTGNGDWIRSIVERSPDPFGAALRLSIAANILDCELRQDVVKGFSMRSLVEGFESLPFAPDNVEDLRAAVTGAERILFVHDAAGELFFDRILIEQMRKPPGAIHSAVRAAPILADATREDAALVGLDAVATIVDPGIDCLGVPLNACSQEFRDIYRSADLIVAKGQACYETLEGKDAEIDGVSKPIFFLLRVKCPVMARHLGAAVGDCVLEASR